MTYMQDSLSQFQSEVDKLRQYLNAVEAEENVLSTLFEEAELPELIQQPSLDSIRKNATNKRRHVYVGAIIVMYGALERFVENAVSDYLESCVKASGAYGNLPEVIRNKHTNQTLEYLALVKDGKIREPEGIDVIAENLLSCIRGNDPYTLNTRAFTIRSANMNVARVRSTLANTGVVASNKNLAGSRYYTKYVRESQGRAVSDIGGREMDALFNHIDELVSIRNDIAHGVNSLDDIEDITIVKDRVVRLEAYVHAVHDCLCESLLRHHVDLGKVIAVAGDIQVFNNSIVCFEFPVGVLVKGDLLMMCSAESGNVSGWGAIHSIQIDRVDQETVEGEAGKMIGVKVDFHAHDGGIFYICPAKTIA